MGNGFFQHNFGLWQITIFLKSKTKQSIYFFLSLLKICYTENLKKNLLLSVFGGILLGLSWPTYGFSFLIFFALIPFIYVAENINADDNKRKGLRVFITTYVGFFVGLNVRAWRYLCLRLGPIYIYRGCQERGLPPQGFRQYLSNGAASRDAHNPRVLSGVCVCVRARARRWCGERAPNVSAIMHGQLRVHLLQS